MVKRRSTKTRRELPEPAIEEFVPIAHGGARDGAGRKRRHRKNISIYIKEEIIKALGPHPATVLR
jgi:hypothetical protein